MLRRGIESKKYLISPLFVRKKTFAQAAKIAHRFGGVANFHRALQSVGVNVARTTVQRWGYPKEKSGSQGIIPPDYLNAIFKAAHREGILLSSEDFDPRTIPSLKTKRARDEHTN